jgi:hypothetical protein
MRPAQRPAGSLFLIYATGADGRQVVLGPSDCFCACGGSLRAGAERREVAAYGDGVWRRPHASGGCFGVMWTECEVQVQFSNPATGASVSAGPFEMIGLVGGMLYVNREHSRALAEFVDGGIGWQLLNNGGLWPEIELRPSKRITDAAQLLLAERLVG